MMDTCKQQTQHKTITDRMLCDAGNASVACERKLREMLSDDPGDYARNNLKSRFGYSVGDIRRAKDLQQS